MKKTSLFVVVLCAMYFWAQTQVRSAANTDSGFQTFLARWEEAQSRFINGDPTLWKQNSWHGDEATIFGAFGGHEKGWNEVRSRYDWASSQFKKGGAKIKVEYLNSGVSGDLAFTVAIEHQENVRLGDQDQAAPRALRVTQIFKKEEGAWKLLHRHADPLVEKKAPSTASQR
jgi:ketosteroid isomerase-like protein